MGVGDKSRFRRLGASGKRASPSGFRLNEDTVVILLCPGLSRIVDSYIAKFPQSLLAGSHSAAFDTVRSCAVRRRGDLLAIPIAGLASPAEFGLGLSGGCIPCIVAGVGTLPHLAKTSESDQF